MRNIAASEANSLNRNLATKVTRRQRRRGNGKTCGEAPDKRGKRGRLDLSSTPPSGDAQVQEIGATRAQLKLGDKKTGGNPLLECFYGLSHPEGDGHGLLGEAPLFAIYTHYCSLV